MMEAVATPRAGESEEEFRKRQAAAGKVINQRAFVFTHGLVQVSGRGQLGLRCDRLCMCILGGKHGPCPASAEEQSGVAGCNVGGWLGWGWLGCWFSQSVASKSYLLR